MSQQQGQQGKAWILAPHHPQLPSKKKVVRFEQVVYQVPHVYHGHGGEEDEFLEDEFLEDEFMCYHTAGTTTLNVISILRGPKGGPTMVVGTPMTSFLPCTRSAETRLEVSVQADSQME